MSRPRLLGPGGLGSGGFGAAQVLLGGVLGGGLLLAATGPPLDDPYAVIYGLGVAGAAVVAMLLVAVAPAVLRGLRARRARPTRARAGAGQPVATRRPLSPSRLLGAGSG